MSSKLIHIPDEYLPEIDELPGDLKRIAAEVDLHRPGDGVEIALLLGQLFPGIPLYMHNIDKLARAIRDDAIRVEYDAGGTTIRELALKYGRSTRRIEQILNQAPSQKELKKKQGSLF